MSNTKLLDCKETSVSLFVLQASFCENFPFESALNGGLRSPLGAQPSPAMESGLWLLHFLLEHFGGQKYIYCFLGIGISRFYRNFAEKIATGLYAQQELKKI